MLRPNHAAVTALLTALVALGPMSTDLYLPSLPALTAYFGVGELAGQLDAQRIPAGPGGRTDHLWPAIGSLWPAAGAAVRHRSLCRRQYRLRFRALDRGAGHRAVLPGLRRLRRAGAGPCGRARRLWPRGRCAHHVLYERRYRAGAGDRADHRRLRRDLVRLARQLRRAAALWRSGAGADISPAAGNQYPLATPAGCRRRA